MDLQEVLHMVPYARDWLLDNDRLCQSYTVFWAWRKQSLLRSTFRTYRDNVMRNKWFRTTVQPAIWQAKSHYSYLQYHGQYERAEHYALTEPVLFPILHLKRHWNRHRALCFDNVSCYYHLTSDPPQTSRSIFWTCPIGQRPDTSLVYHPYIQSWITDWYSRPLPMELLNEHNRQPNSVHLAHVNNSRPSWEFPAFPRGQPTRRIRPTRLQYNPLETNN